MSCRGNRDGGYILLDVLIALLVASIGFTSLFGALKSASAHSVKVEDRALSGLEERNIQADDFGK